MHRFELANLIPLLLGSLVLTGEMKAVAAEAEYKPADQNYYLRAAVLKADPAAVIFRAGDYRQENDSYLVKTHGKAPREVYVEVVKDWLEPVTPPSMPDSLGLEPDVMQIREPQGDVQVAPPNNPTGFVPATEGMPIANGSVIKTGANGTAAVLFGGIDSARLTPNSEALVQQTVMPELRSTRIDLKSGVVFSKVGFRPGAKQDFQVHTPFGIAFAKGTDFVCATLPDRTDVWVAQGTVVLQQPNGQAAGVVKSTGTGTLKVMRFPPIKDAQLALVATTQTLTLALDFIPTVNLKLKTLHDQTAQGVAMTKEEIKYLSYMKHVPVLLRLALVEPPTTPTPSVAPTVPPPAPAPMLKPSTPALLSPPVFPPPMPIKTDTSAAPRAEIAVPDPATTTTAVPPVAPIQKTAPQTLTVTVLSDGSIHFEGAQLSSGHLERRLAQIVKDSPECSVVVRGSQQEQASRIRTVIAMCHVAKIQDVTVAAPDSTSNLDLENAASPSSSRKTSP